MATIDQQFVEYIVKTLVNNPDKVVVDRKIDEKGVLLTLTVDPEDIGRVIGKRGVTAQAIRVLLRALGTKQDARGINENSYSIRYNFNPDRRFKISASASTSSDSNEKAEKTEDEVLEESEETGAADEAAGEDMEESESSELAEKTRAELADLDDLDI